MPTTVLIVDDHPSFRSSARMLLEADGYDVVGEAPDGRSAIVAARELDPDVILLTSSYRTSTASRCPLASLRTATPQPR